MDRSKRIAQLNDELRQTFNLLVGHIFLTKGFSTLPREDQIHIFGLIKAFNDFSADNDPHEKHDFGEVQYKNEKVFWKIDYYDSTMREHSKDAADPEKTTRVMTIMLVNEY
ncbi:MAG: DUF3768 domain-containing protein [Bacteroidota bacterium]